MKSKIATAVKDNIQQVELSNQRELTRRKLDFEIIKDNYKNKATEEILSKFATGKIKGY